MLPLSRKFEMAISSNLYFIIIIIKIIFIKSELQDITSHIMEVDREPRETRQCKSFVYLPRTLVDENDENEGIAAHSSSAPTMFGDEKVFERLEESKRFPLLMNSVWLLRTA